MKTGGGGRCAIVGGFRSMRTLLKALVIGLGTAVLGVILALTPTAPDLEERFGLSWLFWGRGELPPPADVLVVSLDRRSTERLELPEKIRDWPRGTYAKLIERLTSSHVSTIVFDLIFEREREPDQDAILATAIDQAERVVMFESLDLQRQPTPPLEGVRLGLLETQRLRQPLPAFVDAAAGLGPFPLPLVPDRVSQFWAFKPGAGGRPTLPAVALQWHALPAYDAWLTLLERAGFEGIDDLPNTPGALSGASALRQLMVRLRKAFQADSALGEQVAAALSKASVDVEIRRLLRAMLALYDGPDSRYLNFYGPAGHIRTLPLYEALDGGRGAAPSDLEGRVVFVGQSELFEPHNDAFITVFSQPNGVQVSGVEIAATAVANLLDGRTVEPTRHWLPLIAAFGLIIGIVATTLPALWAVPAALAVAVLYYVGAHSAFAAEAVWMPVTIPLLTQLPLGLVAGLLLQYRDAQRARVNIARALRYYLPEKVAAGFAEAPENPFAFEENVYSVCMITDATGFTTLAEKMTSRELKPFLDGYLEILFKAVKQHNGTIIDVAGDGINCVWPSSSPDPATSAKAIEAALQIHRDVDAFNQRNDPLRLPTRIGLNAGWVTLGNVGAAGRFAYTIVGDAINTTSRIEQLNKHLGTKLLSTDAVVRGLDSVHTRALGRFQLMGKEEVLRIVEIMDPADVRRYRERDALFAEALGLFEEQKWEEAAGRFGGLVGEYGDGAAGFYVETCRQIAGGTNATQAPYVVQLSSK